MQKVGCIAYIKPLETLKDIGELSILLVENYRIPVEKTVLEFPSGEVNPSQNYQSYEANEENASKNDNLLNSIIVSQIISELKKCTGYNGEFKNFFRIDDEKFKKTTSLLKNIYFSPWISDENGAFALIEIDKSNHDNQGAKLLVHEIKLKDLLDFLISKVSNESYACAAYVFYFAFGLMFKDIFKEYLI